MQITKTLLLPSRNAADYIMVNNIIRIEALSNYSKLYFNSPYAGRRTLVVPKVLRWFEEQLPYNQFIRIHKTHFINRDFISAYLNEVESKVLSINGEQINIARRRKKMINQFYTA